MKISLKFLVSAICAFAISLVLLSCFDSDSEDYFVGLSSSEQSNSSNNEQCGSPSSTGFTDGRPIMHSRLISYQSTDIGTECASRLKISLPKIITDESILKLCFPNIFENEQKQSDKCNKCKYFALNLSNLTISPYSGYFILSQDAVLYRLVHRFPDLENTTPDMARLSEPP